MDFFDKNFDMNKYPSDFKDPNWSTTRKELADFFEIFIIKYTEHVQKTKYNGYAFKLLLPFHMLLAINNEKLYFCISNFSAFKGRTYLYKLNDGLFLDNNTINKYSIYCGLVNKDSANQGFISDVDISIVKDANNKTDEISILAKELVMFEMSNLERGAGVMKVNPIFGEFTKTVIEKKIFMLMPFGDSDINDFYKDYIKNVVENELGYECMRADDIFDNKPVIQDIWNHINESSIIIADLTHRNPNVFYEVGIAHTIGKNVILISQDINDIPFDLRHIRTIFYEIKPRAVLEFKEKLVKTINKISSIEDIN